MEILKWLSMGTEELEGVKGDALAKYLVEWGNDGLKRGYWN